MFASKQLASRQRVVTATLGWIIAFGIISLASAAIFNVVVCLTALLSFNEFLRMFHINEEIVLYRIAMIAYLLICMAVLGLPLRSLEIGLLVAALIIITTALVTSKDIKQGTEQTAKVFFGVVYVSLFLYLVTLRLMTSGRELILVLSAGTWGRDLAAYFYGRLIADGRAIMPVISPRKTYGGAAFGLVFAVLVVALSTNWLLPEWTLVDKLAVGILIGILGQIGDLVESWLKRSVQVADSSQLLPGQGGMLDSIDSFMFTAPAMYLYVALIIGQ